MTDLKIDEQLLSQTILEITKCFKTIIGIFPDGNDSILRHLAAASIHFALFTRDLSSIVEGKKINVEGEDEFLGKCGCGFNKRKN